MPVVAAGFDKRLPIIRPTTNLYVNLDVMVVSSKHF